MPESLEILDLPEHGQVQLSLVRESGERVTAPPVSFPLPLTDHELSEIAWLLNGYPANPFGASRDRAVVAETGLRDLGRLLLQAVFRSSESASEILAGATSTDAPPFRLAVLSSRPEFLSLPWELLNDPDVDYLVTRAGEITRQPGAPNHSRSSLRSTCRNHSLTSLCYVLSVGMVLRRNPWRRWSPWTLMSPWIVCALPRCRPWRRTSPSAVAITTWSILMEFRRQMAVRRYLALVLCLELRR